jgi:nitrite reductase/ring-hydroxylating ferredoxin subunit/Fe-S cluster biogenesis protein NfuA
MRAEDEHQSREPRPVSGAGGLDARAARDSGVVQLRIPGREPASGAEPGPSKARGSAAVPPLVRDLLALEAVVQGFDERERLVVEAFKRALDALHKEAFARLIRRLKADPAAAVALREAVKDEIVYGVLRHHELLRPSLHERVEAALDSVRPMLASHGGDVQLIAVDPPRVSVRLVGSCDGCSSASLTMAAGVEAAIKQHCPEIEHVDRASGLSAQPAGVSYISPFAHPEQAGWLRVCTLEQIPDGDVWPAELEGRSLLLSRSGAQVSCFDNACAHLGMPLDQGSVHQGVLTCPHHGFRFLLESGECLTVPEVQLVTHAVRVTHGVVEVRLT